jgi:hypothetical protein
VFFEGLVVVEVVEGRIMWLRIEVERALYLEASSRGDGARFAVGQSRV